MANASYSIRPSINGNQHSQFPTGNYVPPPTVLNALLSPAGVSLSFTDNSFGLARNVIRRSTSASGPFYDVINLPAGVTSYLNVEVPPGTYYYQVVALAGNGSSTPSNTVSLTVPGSATGAQYRFTPPPIGAREFQIVNIPTAGLDSGTGAGQRYVITFATNSGYLLLAPPDSAITGMVDIETNAQTVVLHGAEFLPDFAVEKVTGPAGNLTVGKVLDIFTTGSNSPEIYLYKTKFRTTDDNGRVVWNAGDPVNVGGTQSADNTKWPLTYMEQNWVDDLYGFAVDTVGHTDVIKSNSGPVRGFRIARNRWACSYQFFILFTGHNETWGAYPGGTNEMFDNQWYSINPPPSWSEPVANNLYLSTSYTNQVSNGFYHAYLFNGTGAGGTDGYGTYINMSGNTQDANLGGIMSPPLGYGFQLSGNNLVPVAGQPPTNRNADQDWCQGIVYYGDHPKLNDTSTRDRPVMRAETGCAYRITTREQLEAIIATAAPNAPTSFAASVSGTTINLSWTDTNGGAAQTVIERSTDAGATWSALTTVAAGTSAYANSGLSAGTYHYRARALTGSTYSASYTSTANATVAATSFALTASVLFNGTNGSPVGIVTLPNSGELYTSYGGGYGTLYSNAQTRGGRATSGRMTIRAGSDGDPGDAADGYGASTGLWGCTITLPTDCRCVEGDTLHTIMAVYFDADFDFHTPTGLLKFLRYFGTNFTGHLDHAPTTYGYVEADVAHASPSPQTGWMWGNEDDHSGEIYQAGYGQLSGIKSNRIIPLGQWVVIEHRQKFSSNPALASRTTWVNGNFVADFTGNTKTYINAAGSLTTLTGGQCKNINPTTVFTAMRLFTYWNGYSPKDQGIYIDRVDFKRFASGASISLPNTDAYGNSYIGLGVI